MCIAVDCFCVRFSSLLSRKEDMKIHIVKHYWSRHVQQQPGKTQAEKESRAEPTAALGSPGRAWHETMTKTQGQWIEVETEFLFEDQFNTETARVDCAYIDAIDFSPEFANVEDFLAAVQTRYNKDWPGRKIRQVLANHITIGNISDQTPTVKDKIADHCETLQDNLICILDNMDEQIVDAVCEAVVNQCNILKTQLKGKV